MESVARECGAEDQRHEKPPLKTALAYAPSQSRRRGSRSRYAGQRDRIALSAIRANPKAYGQWLPILVRRSEKPVFPGRFERGIGGRQRARASSLWRTATDKQSAEAAASGADMPLPRRSMRAAPSGFRSRASPWHRAQARRRARSPWCWRPPRHRGTGLEEGVRRQRQPPDVPVADFVPGRRAARESQAPELQGRVRLRGGSAEGLPTAQDVARAEGEQYESFHRAEETRSRHAREGIALSSTSHRKLTRLHPVTS